MAEFTEHCSIEDTCSGGSFCKIESIVSVDERGQMVLPKEIRSKAGINTGDKMALVTWENKEEICCIALIKVERLSTLVKNVLGPLMRGIDE